MASRQATVFGCVLDAMKWVVNSWQRSLQESMEFLLKFLNQVTTPHRIVVMKSLHFTAPCTNRYVRTASMFSMCSSESVVPSYESISGGFSSPRGWTARIAVMSGIPGVLGAGRGPRAYVASWRRSPWWGSSRRGLSW